MRTAARLMFVALLFLAASCEGPSQDGGGAAVGNTAEALNNSYFYGCWLNQSGDELDLWSEGTFVHQTNTGAPQVGTWTYQTNTNAIVETVAAGSNSQSVGNIYPYNYLSLYPGGTYYFITCGPHPTPLIGSSTWSLLIPADANGVMVYDTYFFYGDGTMFENVTLYRYGYFQSFQQYPGHWSADATTLTITEGAYTSSRPYVQFAAPDLEHTALWVGQFQYHPGP